MRVSSEEATDTALIAACSGVFYAVGIGSGSQLSSDDVLYAQMAREMLHSGNWLDNLWLGVTHFEKPPLLLWCLALSGAVFGFGEAALRLPITLWSVAGLVSLYLLARSLDVTRRAALTATGLLATSTFYLLMTRRPMTDIPLVSCALIAAAAWLRGRAVTAGVFAGLAVLAKGVAALPLLPAAIIVHQRDLRSVLRATCVMLLVAAPWHIAQALRHGTEFWSGYLGHHVAARMTSAVVPGLQLHEQWELLAREPVLLALALLGLGIAVAQRCKQASAGFALCWLVLAALPLIASKTVLPHYLLPLIPGLVLLGAQALNVSIFRQRLGVLLSAALVLAALVSDQDKLGYWLDPDFSPDDKAVGARLAELAQPHDSVATYNLTNSALVFYSGGMPISIYSDDAQVLAVQASVLMNQRQAGKPGGVVDLRRTSWPASGAGRRFVVTHSGSDSTRLKQLLRTAVPERALFRRDFGGLALVNDAQEGVPVAH